MKDKKMYVEYFSDYDMHNIRDGRVYDVVQ